MDLESFKPIALIYILNTQLKTCSLDLTFWNHPEWILLLIHLNVCLQIISRIIHTFGHMSDHTVTRINFIDNYYRSLGNNIFNCPITVIASFRDDSFVVHIHRTFSDFLNQRFLNGVPQSNRKGIAKTVNVFIILK